MMTPGSNIVRMKQQDWLENPSAGLDAAEFVIFVVCLTCPGWIIVLVSNIVKPLDHIGSLLFDEEHVSVIWRFLEK